jgi:Zn finger protein HypA/HybF involved in hydrogenase expression
MHKVEGLIKTALPTINNIIEKCVDCKKDFERVSKEIVHHRCPQCQAKFRIDEANGLYPATKETWMDKLKYMTK